jgi:hypothetical protein
LRHGCSNVVFNSDLLCFEEACSLHVDFFGTTFMISSLRCLLLMFLLAYNSSTALFAQTKSPESTPKPPVGRYIDNGDGTITDRSSGLVWQSQDGGEMTIEQARRYAEELVLGATTTGDCRSAWSSSQSWINDCTVPR